MRNFKMRKRFTDTERIFVKACWQHCLYKHRCQKYNLNFQKMYVDIFLFLSTLLLTLINANIFRLTPSVSICYSKLITTVHIALNFCKQKLQIMKWFNRPSFQEKDLLDQRQELRQELSQINMIDNFAKHAKIQRKINAIDEQLTEFQSNRRSNSLIRHLFFQYGMKIPISLILLLMIIYYRKTPVFILSEKFDLFPFSSIISYPLTEINGISMHVWVMCCTSVAQLIKY